MLVAPAAKSLAARVKSLEAENVALKAELAETKAAVAPIAKKLDQWEHVGGWRRGETYRQHNFVTHGSSQWKCVVDATTDRPGESNAWRLVTKAER